LVGGSDSVANGINDVGQAVGLSSNGTNVTGIIWNGNTPTALGTLPGSSISWANAINNAGLIVGFADTFGTGTSHAVLWQNGTIFDLNALLDSSGAGWTLEEAFAINLTGQIVGFGFNNTLDGTNNAAFLLTPCPTCVPIPCAVCDYGTTTPLPAALPLFATGLGMMGLLGWRRRRKAAQSKFEFVPPQRES
jgi:probable HAF family extracellular repeat protein